ncbi:hypothetical protein KY349_03545 [Candidatus Woesearchaeota archaeon]|nr:hypothetical protein [Candidatus Woesearchaeota archaeon]
METKQEVTKNFVLGIVLIVVSLVLGKLVFVPIILFPGSEAWRIAMITVYVFSWIMLIPGVYLAGLEGYRLVTHKYKEYHRRTIHKVKEHSKRAARKTVDVLKRPVRRRKKKKQI